jgi:hypothetical protein
MGRLRVIFVRPLILIALIKILIQTNKPFLCSGIYAGLATLFGLFMGSGLAGAVVGGGIAFVLSSLYFWLLDRFDGSILWWIIAVGGLVIGLV